MVVWWCWGWGWGWVRTLVVGQAGGFGVECFYR